MKRTEVTGDCGVLTRAVRIATGLGILAGATALEAKWPKGAVPLASAALVAKSGSNVTGTVDFAIVGGNLLLRVYAQNLSAGPHGIHVHENGNCDAEDASSAGEHFNPTQAKHGGPKGR